MSGTHVRNIILLSDGTGNSASSLFKTNVRRLYEALDLADPKDPEHPRQFAYYDDGVGTSSFRPLAVLGGAFGYGLARNVRDLYTFLCRTYRPGDRIYAFGFSRGAFTIRITIGLIVSQGILAHDGDEATLERNVRAAYRAYRKERYGWRPLTFLGRMIRDAILWAYWKVRRFTAYRHVKRHWIGAPDEGTIEFLGVWDTVDAYGLPIEELTHAVDTVVIPLTMKDADLAPEVKRARHALSLDDQRNTFHPRLWNEEKEDDPYRIRQVWFAGVHADVGGGYPDGGLAHVALRWMMDEAENAAPGPTRLRFLDEVRAVQQALADENAPLHDSRHGLASYYRYKPRNLAALSNQPANLARGFEVKLKTPIIHESVLRRIQVGQDGYAPISLPSSFQVQLVGGRSKDVEDGDGHLWEPNTSEATKADFAKRREHVWNFVWWRRIAYFVTLGGTLFLAALPLFMEVKGCSSWACFLSPTILATDYILPGFAKTWTQVFASNPATTLLGAGVVLFGTLLGRNLDVRIPDEMRRLWYSTKLKPSRKGGMVGFTQPRDRGGLNAAVQNLRTSDGYKFFWEVMRRIVIPTIALVGAAVLILGGVNMTLLSAMESWGLVCGNPEQQTQGSPFRTNSLCYRAVKDIKEEGATYRLRVTIPARSSRDPEPVQEGCRSETAAQRREWLDCSMSATPNGIRRAEDEWWMAAMVPFRRHASEPWYKLMVRIGEKGSDIYALDWRLTQDPGPVTGDLSATYEARLRARRTGPLFLYVNDAAPIVALRYFYENNYGTADIDVQLIDREEPHPP